MRASELASFRRHVDSLSGLHRIIWAMSVTRPNPHAFTPSGTDDKDIIMAQSRYQDALERHAKAYESCLTYLHFAKGNHSEVPGITCQVERVRPGESGGITILLEFYGERVCAFMYSNGTWSGHS